MNVLLLRSPTSDVPDRYEAAFRTHGYSPISAPILETTLVHLEQLASKIDDGPSVHRFTGVVVTSKRSIEAWNRAVDCIVTRSRENDVVREVGSGGEDETSWAPIPFYILGDVTAGAARELGKRLPCGLGPMDVRGGSGAGSAEQLARVILEDGDVSGSKKMLYLTGDKNRDTMSKMLDTGRIYETCGSSTFAHDLEDALRKIMRRRAWGWIVFFAPSAARHVYPALCDRFFFRRLNDTDGTEIAKVAAIGPTTASFLREEMGLRVDVVAPKPTPAELANTIAAFDSPIPSV
ncbi:tetrapyrrole biosynthesis, uroporphyrinogen III synthase [Pisolithus orientalis]|uniref:tetrapyrrole biosynthesis, uroporphyrinogen III synthase n=1 Tax=Pisolithus orientalis TaxID=936130 RepID=UPI002224574E|nr:tetrapyrrole biosynthesis, uroporphyrinogen III synthase [Pisolithus orientalis]KAI6002389.1 tetrapyrrole biosynthesis, uroporphyrinogen III synthase [Pisolithus orientalis]